MASMMCPLLTEKTSDPILCRHDCAWYVVLPPSSEFDELDEPREGCGINILARELCVKGTTLAEVMLRLDKAIERAVQSPT